MSGDGWNWSTAARATDSVEKTFPVNYAGHGIDYTYEGGRAQYQHWHCFASGTPQPNPLTPPDDPTCCPARPTSAHLTPQKTTKIPPGAGYLWDGALRAKLSVRNYGFFIDLFRYRFPKYAPGYWFPCATLAP